MHIRLQRFYLGLLLLLATSRTQTGFTRIRCLQILSPTTSSPSDLARALFHATPEYLLWRLQYFLLTLMTPRSSCTVNQILLEHLSFFCCTDLSFYLSQPTDLLQWNVHMPPPVLTVRAYLKCWELFVVTVAPLFMHVCSIMSLKRKVSKKHVWCAAHINLRGNPQFNIGTCREKQIRTDIWQRNNSAYRKTLHV